MSALLETRNLGKSFGHFAANAAIDFAVEPGELRAVTARPWHRVRIPVIAG